MFHVAHIKMSQCQRESHKALPSLLTIMKLSLLVVFLGLLSASAALAETLEACNQKCATTQANCFTACEEELHDGADKRIATDCKTECAREQHYCRAGCTATATATAN